MVDQRAQPVRAGVLVPDVRGRALSRTAEARLQEFNGLAEAIDLEIVFSEVVKVREIRPSTFISAMRPATLNARLTCRTSMLPCRTITDLSLDRNPDTAPHVASARVTIEIPIPIHVRELNRLTNNGQRPSFLEPSISHRVLIGAENNIRIWEIGVTILSLECEPGQQVFDHRAMIQSK